MPLPVPTASYVLDPDADVSAVLDLLAEQVSGPVELLDPAAPPGARLTGARRALGGRGARSNPGSGEPLTTTVLDTADRLLRAAGLELTATPVSSADPALIAAAAAGTAIAGSRSETGGAGTNDPPPTAVVSGVRPEAGGTGTDAGDPSSTAGGAAAVGSRPETGGTDIGDPPSTAAVPGARPEANGTGGGSARAAASATRSGPGMADGSGRPDGDVLLVLHGVPGEPTQQAVAARAHRYLATDLPPGLLRERVAPVVDIRALLPIVEIRRREVAAAVRNRDDKIVVRLTFTHMTACRPSSGDRAGLLPPPPPRVTQDASTTPPAPADPPGLPASAQAATPAERASPADPTAVATPAQRTPADPAAVAPAAVAIPAQPGTPADPVTLHTRVEVAGVLGYPKPFARVQQAIAEAPLGLREVSESVADEAVVALGGIPQGLAGKVDVGLLPGDRADVAAVRILRALAHVVESNVPGTVEDLDIEFLHDLRVAVRKSRSVLRELKQVFEPEARRAQADALRWVQAVTGPTRDLDVQLLEWDELAAYVPTERRRHLEPVRELLRTRRAEAYEDLVTILQGDEHRRRWAAWRAFLAGDLGPEEPRPDAALPVRDVAGRRIRTVYKRMVGMGRAIDDRSPAQALHDLRKRGKELRYLLELFGKLWPPGVVKPMVTSLKGLQDVLGRHQDREVQATQLRSLAPDLLTLPVGGADALLAMGSLIDRLEAEQTEARAGFADRFAAFTGLEVPR